MMKDDDKGIRRDTVSKIAIDYCIGLIGSVAAFSVAVSVGLHYFSIDSSLFSLVLEGILSFLFIVAGIGFFVGRKYVSIGILSIHFFWLIVFLVSLFV
jgi:hypothetical protein